MEINKNVTVTLSPYDIKEMIYDKLLENGVEARVIGVNVDADADSSTNFSLRDVVCTGVELSTKNRTLMEGAVKQCGFESLVEFNNLIANLDLSNPDKVVAFKRWQLTDGTKEGLLKL